jgi:hypothetical protein
MMAAMLDAPCSQNVCATHHAALRLQFTSLLRGRNERFPLDRALEDGALPDLRSQLGF